MSMILKSNNALLLEATLNNHITKFRDNKVEIFDGIDLTWFFFSSYKNAFRIARNKFFKKHNLRDLNGLSDSDIDCAINELFDKNKPSFEFIHPDHPSI